MIERRLTWVLGGLLNPLVFAALTRAADASDVDIDKSQYHILNPTPAQYLREMDTDGPGATESPYTVDAGHFQIELTFLAYTSERERLEGKSYELDAWAIAPMILKVGLLNQLDAQLVLEPYQVVEERIGSQRVTSRGFGDMTLRLKYNFWGNDRGRTAFAATPYVKFPTSAEGLGNNSIEGGLVLPLSMNLPENFWVGFTTRFDAVRDWDDDGYHPEFMNSISFGAPLFAKGFGYMEFFSLVSTDRDAEWVGTLNTGFIYSLSANLQLNAGVNLGLTRSAYDWTAFAGMAWRF
jgi:outer membrane putative beta-barrel porin/alpha-amylase